MSLFLGRYERHGAGLLLIQTENYDPISKYKRGTSCGNSCQLNQGQKQVKVKWLSSTVPFITLASK